MKKNNNSSSHFSSFVILITTLALIILLGISTKGFRDWSFGFTTEEPNTSLPSSSLPGSSTPGTSLPGSSQPGTSLPGTSSEPTKPDPEPVIKEYKVEAEECTLNIATSQDSMPWASNGHFVGGFSEGASISFTTSSSEATKATFEIVLANITTEDINLSSLTNFLVVNETAVTFPEASVVAAPTQEEITALNNQYPEQTPITAYGVFKTISVEIDLLEGNNTISLNGPGNFNFDYFNLKTTANLITVLNKPVDEANWSALNTINTITKGEVYNG